jgi:hypothetical protein
MCDFPPGARPDAAARVVTRSSLVATAPLGTPLQLAGGAAWDAIHAEYAGMLAGH